MNSVGQHAASRLWDGYVLDITSVKEVLWIAFKSRWQLSISVDKAMKTFLLCWSQQIVKKATIEAANPMPLSFMTNTADSTSVFTSLPIQVNT